ncbi:tRNA (adenosine(37)-N6)-dimethylallyltransferase MiaA [Candidatus Falkowbacteria bacterium CG10_big_fil_rev_8_21_14_0_10_43_10]|uniref:tRNA dimethylallyltransferase n=1 Tax=Candidatus Falkowbacteria bacterium CG10_big_fil_rev_8_21_14_0_10_43_10 TaxID=1974567 RepID=A0A2H0V1B3_9BACT|nr:MAG: tRNA (adenosine(37)-N6)-dimethylallyltransferase MiaA [Candidatus Falkowbacteria bacterium CG10_big_fil_rev_8_21_14_0_10_43_10]
MKNRGNNKLLVILGPTSSGKTKLAVKLAYKFNGEIVSADSRQVYKGMDVGTGKDLKDYFIKIPNNKKQKSNKFQIINSKSQRKFKFQILKVPYHCIDVVSPKTEFNLAKYVKLANRAICDVQRRGKLPILVGGAGLYAQAVVDMYNLTGAKPDKKLRERLEKMPIEKLRKLLRKLDRNYDGNLDNKRYLIRYIEIVSQSKKKLKKLVVKKGSAHDCLVLGIKFPREEINKRIDKRLIERIEREDMIGEVKSLHQQGVSWKRLESFGLEYRFVSQYLQGKLGREEMAEKLKIAIHQFAKRQMTWYRRWEKQGRTIKWINDYREGRRLIKRWLVD